MQLLRVLSRTQEEAQHFKHNYIGTEHLLLALIQESKGVAAEVLGNLEIDTNKVRETIGSIIDHGESTLAAEIEFAPRAIRVIELAKVKAKSMNHHYVGIEHLLLGLVLEGEGIAAGILGQMGATLERVHSETSKVLDK